MYIHCLVLYCHAFFPIGRASLVSRPCKHKAISVDRYVAKCPCVVSGASKNEEEQENPMKVLLCSFAELLACSLAFHAITFKCSMYILLGKSPVVNAIQLSIKSPLLLPDYSHPLSENEKKCIISTAAINV